MSEAEEAAALWGGVPGRLLGNRENIVHELLRPGGERAVLRLHRPGYQGDAGIRAELEWVAALAAQGLPVAAPIPPATRAPDAAAGASPPPRGEGMGVGGSVAAGGDAPALFAILRSGRRASAVRWLPGRPLGTNGEALPGTREEQVALFRALGTLLRRLHEATDALALPVPFARPEWGVDGLTGEAPVWGRFWEHPAATPAQAATLRAAREALRVRLTRWRAEGLSYGPVHADVLRENVLVAEPAGRGAPPPHPSPTGGEGGAGAPRLSLIDFDDSGTGFRLYDLGTALVQNLNEPAYPALRDALCQGYGGADPAQAEWFVLARCCASVGWPIPRLAPDHPIHASHIARATGLAQRLM